MLRSCTIFLRNRLGASQKEVNVRHSCPANHFGGLFFVIFFYCFMLNFFVAFLLREISPNL